MTLGRLAYAASHQGDYDRATTVLAESAAFQRELGTRLSLGEALGDLGFLAYLKGDYTSARSRLEEYLAIVRELGLRWRIQVILSLLGEAARCLGDYEGAAALYAEGLTLSRELDDKAATCMLLLNLGFVAHQQGDHSLARARFAESLSLSFGLSNQRLIDVALSALAMVAAAQEQTERAGRLFGAAEALAQVLGIVLDPPDQLQYEQAVAAARARPDAATFDTAWAEGRAMNLEEAIQLAQSVETLDVSHPRVEPMKPLAGTAVTDVAPLPELRIIALGADRVYRGERLLAPADWTFAQPRELLFYLLAHPASTKEQIGLALWPDASPAQLRGSFHNTLYHLRRALGRRDWIIAEEIGYRFNRALDYWFDVETFEKHIADSRAQIAKGGDPAKDISHLQSAIGLYQGDFLSDSDREWVILKREALRRQYLDALLALGQALFASGDYTSAANTYRQAIGQDAYIEAAHRELMRCYARLGERGQALRHYQGLVELLRDELDAPPAAETTALFERLKRGEDV